MICRAKVKSKTSGLRFEHSTPDETDTLEGRTDAARRFPKIRTCFDYTTRTLALKFQ